MHRYHDPPPAASQAMALAKTAAQKTAHPLFWGKAAPGPTYSNDCEDMVAFRSFFSADFTGPGFFVEVGGWTGVESSNTLFFEETLGWDGLLLEASPQAFAHLQCVGRRAFHANAAVCDEARTVCYVAPVGKTTGGIKEFMSPERVKMWLSDTDPSFEVTCLPLNAILGQLGIRHISFFSLDVEGAEWQVVRTFNFSAVRVDVWCIEKNLPASKKVHILMLQNDYIFLGEIARNVWYAHRAFGRRNFDAAESGARKLLAKHKRTGRDQCRQVAQAFTKKRTPPHCRALSPPRVKSVSTANTTSGGNRATAAGPVAHTIRTSPLPTPPVPAGFGPGSSRNRDEAPNFRLRGMLLLFPFGFFSIVSFLFWSTFS